MISKDEAKNLGLKIKESENPLFAMLKNNFPQSIKDGKVDLNAIAQLLGLKSQENIGGYELTFTGKGLANALYNSPCEKELKLDEIFNISNESIQSGSIITHKNDEKVVSLGDFVGCEAGSKGVCLSQMTEADSQNSRKIVKEIPFNAKNIIIKGDNLDALKILKSAYSTKIKMIYIDPPYSTESDNFLYPDNFRDDFKAILREVGLIEIDENGQEVERENLKFFKNITGARTHSGWLAFMLPRLKLARDLLKDDGVIFISIDDNEQANLKLLCDEIFGEDNFISTLHIELSTTQGMKVAAAQKGQIVKNAEYILVYAKNIESFNFERILYTTKEWDDHYSVYINPKTKQRDTLLNFLKTKYGDITKSKLERLYEFDDDFRDFIHKNAKDIYRDAMIDINFDFKQNEEQALNNGEIIAYKDYLIFKTSTGVIRQLLSLEKAIGETNDFEAKFGLRKIRGDWWGGFYKDMMNINKEGGVIFKNGKKPVRLIKDLLKISTSANQNKNPDIILDFFAGSGTTAQAVMELNSEDNGNREFILVQIEEKIDEKKSKTAFDFCKNELKSTSPVISDITIERVKRASKKLNYNEGFKVFSITDKPKIIESKGALRLQESSSLSPFDKALNLALNSGVMLNLPLKEVLKNKLYECENAYFVVEFDDEVLKILQKSQNEIYISAFSNIDLETLLNLNVSFKERLVVIY